MLQPCNKYELYRTTYSYIHLQFMSVISELFKWYIFHFQYIYQAGSASDIAVLLVAPYHPDRRHAFTLLHRPPSENTRTPPENHILHHHSGHCNERHDWAIRCVAGHE